MTSVAQAHRAVLVVYDSRLIAERYAPGCARVQLLGWSMSRASPTPREILVKRAGSRSTQPAPVPEWQAQGDPRAITLDQLMRMSSGLEFDRSTPPSATPPPCSAKAKTLPPTPP
jgi:hypothetical protein